MRSFKEYITEIFDEPIEAVNPVIRKVRDPSGKVTYMKYGYKLTAEQTGGPRGMVQIIRKLNTPSAYVEFDFGRTHLAFGSARRKKVLSTKVALQTLGHVMSSVNHHINTHDGPTTHITYYTDSPRRDRMYKMIGKRLGISMTNKFSATDLKGSWGINNDILERGSRIGSVKKRKEYFEKASGVLQKQGTKASTTAA